MAKRKQPEPDADASPEVSETPSKRRRRTSTNPAPTNGFHDDDHNDELAVSAIESTPNKQQRTPSKAKRKSAAETLLDEEQQADEGSPTPKATGRTLFSTPRRTKATVGNTTTPSKSTPSKSKADRSAKRKSARALAEAEAEAEEEDDWDGQVALAKEILGAEEVEEEEEEEDENESASAKGPLNEATDITEQTAEPEDSTTTTPVKTPGSRGRGRPKGAKNKRSPTPEGDIAPEERYFFQNRAGPPQISSNKFTSVKLLNHEEYFKQIQQYQDPHERDRAQLMKLHARSFAQWSFELDQGFGLCLYGYGSKRGLTNKFAEWLYQHKQKQRRPVHNPHDAASRRPPPPIVVVNGYTPKLNVRGILNTIAAAVTTASDGDHDNEQESGDDDEDDQDIQRHQHNHRKRLRLVGQPHEMLDTLLAYLSAQDSPDVSAAADSNGGTTATFGGGDDNNSSMTNHHTSPIHLILVINSIDALPLRRAGTQSLLARLSAHPQIQFIATADTPTFPSLWNSTLSNQFRFAFHDCTTFAPYSAAELSVVDEVHELLGRKRLRAGGKEGIGFVLKSLPENARNLYRLLIGEILEILTETNAEDIVGTGDGVSMRNGNSNGNGTIGDGDDQDEDEVDNEVSGRKRPAASARKSANANANTSEVGVEYRTLYQKASEEFICSSSMNFQFLLKEFHDHQMITSRRDAGGTEVLSVPLDRGEMEAVLEDLVV